MRKWTTDPISTVMELVPTQQTASLNKEIVANGCERASALEETVARGVTVTSKGHREEIADQGSPRHHLEDEILEAAVEDQKEAKANGKEARTVDK